MYPQEQFAPPPAMPVIFKGGKVWYLDAAPARLRMCGGCSHTNCSGCPRLGATAASQDISAGSSAAAGILALSAAAGPAAPIVAAIGSIASLIASLFKGCGQACIEAATLEQIPEATLHNLHAVALQQPGAISGPQFQEAWNEVNSQGLQMLQNLLAQGDKKAQDSINNLEKSTDYTSFVATLPPAPTAALNVSQAQTAFLAPNAAGWYATSLAQANNFANQILQAFASGSSAGSTVTAFETATGLSGTVLLAGAALVAYLLLGRN